MKSKLFVIIFICVLLANISFASAAFSTIKILSGGDLGITFSTGILTNLNQVIQRGLSGCGFGVKESYFYFPKSGDIESHLDNLCLQTITDASTIHGAHVSNILKHIYKPIFIELKQTGITIPVNLEINEKAFIVKGKIVFPVTEKNSPGWIAGIVSRDLPPHKMILSGAEINFRVVEGIQQNQIILNKAESFIGFQHQSTNDYLFLDSSNLIINYQTNQPPKIAKGKQFNIYFASYGEDSKGKPLFNMKQKTISFQTIAQTSLEQDRLGDYCELKGRFKINNQKEDYYYNICDNIKTGLILNNLGNAVLSFLDSETSIKSENFEIIQPNNLISAKNLI